MPTTELIIGALIIFTGAFVQGSSGFGFGLVSMPFLVMIFPFSTVPPTISLLVLFNSSIVAFQAKKSANSKAVFRLLPTAFIGIFIGYMILKSVNETVYSYTVATFIIGVSLFMMLGWKKKIRRENIGLSIAGFISGILSTSTSTSGPPVILFFANQGYSKEQIRGSISRYFLFLGLLSSSLFFYKGDLNKEIVQRVAFFFIPLIAGTITGISISKHIKETTFRRGILWMIFTSGIILILKTTYKAYF